MSDILIKGIQNKETTLRDYFSNTLDFEFYYRHPRNYNRRAIFSIDEPAPTMRGVNRPVPQGYHGHPNDACPISNNIRALTTLERALIQTFPASFKWCGNKTEMEQMIGNAVPVKLAEYVALAIKQYIKTERQFEKDKDLFINWLINIKNYSQRSAKDTISRIRRADKICHIDAFSNKYYFYNLMQAKEYNNLSISVRSQIKRALSLYYSFIMNKDIVL